MLHVCEAYFVPDIRIRNIYLPNLNPINPILQIPSCTHWGRDSKFFSSKHHFLGFKIVVSVWSSFWRIRIRIRFFKGQIGAVSAILAKRLIPYHHELSSTTVHYIFTPRVPCPTSLRMHPGSGESPLASGSCKFSTHFPAPCCFALWNGLFFH